LFANVLLFLLRSEIYIPPLKVGKPWKVRSSEYDTNSTVPVSSLRLDKTGSPFFLSLKILCWGALSLYEWTKSSLLKRILETSWRGKNGPAETSLSS
jgi:hypothetical protein